MVRNKLLICRDYHIQPSELDRMQYFDYEHILEEINVLQKEQEKQNEEQEKMMNKINPNSMHRSMQNTMSNYRPPKVSIPKF